MGRTRSDRASDKAGPRAAAPSPAAQPRHSQPLLEMQAMAGNEVVNRLLDGHLQAKLMVGAATDSCEREADQVAQMVGEMLCSPAAPSVGGATVARSAAVVGTDGGSVDG